MPLGRLCAAQTRQREIRKTSVTGKILYTNSPSVRDFYLPESCFILMDFSAQGCKEGRIGNAKGQIAGSSLPPRGVDLLASVLFLAGGGGFCGSREQGPAPSSPADACSSHMNTNCWKRLQVPKISYCDSSPPEILLPV